MTLPYNIAGIVLAEGAANDSALVRALQRDLRALGYMRQGIDGNFGPATARAVRALQYSSTTMVPRAPGMAVPLSR